MNASEKSEPERADRSYQLQRLKVVKIPGGKEGWESFYFRQIFGEEATNKQVFGPCKALIDRATQGYNSTIFVYGQTGSGKTYTL